MSTITVIRAGYVGRVTTAGFAHLGDTVVCADSDSHKIDGDVVAAGLGLIPSSEG